MAPQPPPPEGQEQQQERYQPLALIGVTLIALLGFAVFFLSFLVAPLAILLIFYVGFSASDRSKRKDKNPPPAPEEEQPPTVAAAAPAPTATPESRERAAMLAREAQYRRQTLDRANTAEPTATDLPPR